MTTENITIFVVIDDTGKWAAMGLSGHKPQTLSELKSQLEDWNIDEGFGFCRVYKIETSVETPTMEEVIDHKGEIKRMDLML